MPVWAIVLIVVVVLLVLWLLSTYNSLVKARLKVDNQWSQIDVQLKMRADLIPNLVETVSGYTDHERGTLNEVVAARTKYLAAGSPAEMMEASGELSGLLTRLFAVAESYPDLKANTNFMQLQNQLSDLEGKIANYRQFYNDTVMRYNQMTQTIPSNIVASLFGFKERDFLAVDEADRAVPKIDFKKK